MGCGHSKHEVETGHIHVKSRRKSRKSRDFKTEKIETVPKGKENALEKQNVNTHLEKNNETLVGNSIEGLICDGVSGKTEYFSPKKSDIVYEKENVHENVFLNDRDLSIEEVICDGVSGKTEYYSPNRVNAKDGINDDENGNGSLSVEGVICDGCSGKTDYYSPKKSRDDVEVEDKEVLVEEKTGEVKKTGETEEAVGDRDLTKSEFDSFEKPEFFILEKTNVEGEGKDFPSKDKENETETTVHVSGFAFDTLLSWWKTREV